MKCRSFPLAFLAVVAPITAIIAAEERTGANASHPTGAAISLFDGKTFNGWEGDTNRTWRIENDEIVGGSLEANVPRNEFLCTTRPFTNFVLRLKFKLAGKSGFINAGVQFRSQRVKDPPNEMAGYQADIGDPDYWGSIYDEGIRNRTLAKADMEALNRVLKRDGWNEYVVRAERRRVRLWINGLQTVDYTEPEPQRPQWGIIGLQIHGRAVAEVRYKDLGLEELAEASEPDRAKSIDRIFEASSKPGTPGAGVAVIEHGALVFEKGYGLANLEYDIPVTPQTIFHVASVSKQFTAMALVLLDQDGKLSLEDDVHKYLPELPDYGHKITLRHLLQHTSGIRDQWQTLALAGWRMDDVITQKQILGLLFRQKELNFTPGTAHLYSNGGYTLAAEVAARVSGKPFPEFCRERIFGPAGMTRTHFHDDHRRIVRDRAYSYEKVGEGYQASPLNYANVGATSLFTTAGDLVRWLDNFRAPKLGGRAAFERLQEQAVLADGKKIDYALGVVIGQYRGLKTISHSGGDAGYRSEVLWFPESDLGIAVLGNLASFSPFSAARRVAEVFLGDKMAPEPTNASSQVASGKPRSYIALAESALEPLVGHYKLESGLEADVLKENGKLFAHVPGQGKAELHPLATDRFFIEELGGEVQLLVKPDGPVRLKFTHEGATINGERTGPVSTMTPDLAQYQGVYWSDELETQYTVRLKDGKLTADHVRHGQIALEPAGLDRFTASEWFMAEVHFLRDTTNGISGMTLGGGRVKGIPFNRRFAVSTLSATTTWRAAAGNDASEANPGTAQQPVRSVAKAVSLAKPGDVIVFAPGTYLCSGVTVSDGREDLPITLRSDGTGKVIFTNDGARTLLRTGSYNTIDGIEFRMTGEHPRGSGISVERKEHVVIRNCRFYACQVGVSAASAHYLTIRNCEMAYSGAYGVHLNGSGQDTRGHWNPADECRHVEVRNCYLHDAGWNVNGTEGYGVTANGAAEYLVIENCQIDNNSGDGILYEDWTVHSTARYNVIRGTGIAAIWIDNASMSVFDNNYLEANNVAVWLSGEESSNRYLDDFISIRNNIIVHNDWSAIDPSVYGKAIFLITSSTRDTYFDNNTVAFNKCGQVVRVENRPPQNEYRNIWFRNNVFWQNTGPVTVDAALNSKEFHVLNNLWDKPCERDAEAKTGDPLFVDPKADAPEGYKLQSASAARSQGILLYENQVDFWNGQRPHLSKTEKYDLGAHQFGTTGAAHVGLDRAAFPFEVPAFKLQFKAKPKF
ncbi:MAG: serine hydrolase [Verrucomicrobiota bacterium]|jgi:CubicO group peptidase (beta-lactamase class C family)